MALVCVINIALNFLSGVPYFPRFQRELLRDRLECLHREYDQSWPMSESVMTG